MPEFSLFDSLVESQKVQAREMLGITQGNISLYRQKHRETVIHESSPWELEEPGIGMRTLDFSYMFLSTTVPHIPILNLAAFSIL